LVTSLNKGIETSTKELGKKSLDYMKKQYMENNLSSHTGNITLTPYKNRYKNGFIISSGDDEVAVYNEFGTGIVGSGNSNPLATDTGYEYNVNSPHKGVIPEGAYYQYPIQYLEAVNTPDTWWYFKNGKWWHTEGMKGKNMYYGLVEEIRDVYVNDLKVAVSQTIGNYGGKK
jgi:hypothetical protein